MNTAQRLMRYKAWANNRTLEFLETLPEGTAEQPHSTFFGSIIQTLQHNYIVDDIFRFHWQGVPHGYSSRRSGNVPALVPFRDQVREMDRWWIAEADALTPEALHEGIDFRFLDGSQGHMTRLEIVMHLVNHTSYYRGFADEILGQMGHDGPACDLPVYLQEMKAPGT
ncbi:DinB family protein [Leisingera sp. SS27]|uniref:DinB family protein n=1 Tax=Leisingera sp. SS27 TaxID=2979462 RepID=UPI0023301513|nr:DinB family protein [Leisingera sp. SS27]MDC0656398.1 DinB family protein [Leisingera sp. SS27]